MNEQSKAAIRRKLDPRYHDRWLVGRGIDIGCGPDPLSTENYPSIAEVVPYDTLFGNIDGQFLPEIKDAEFDFVHSSHSLEHMQNPVAALNNWMRVLKPGGFVVCTVPDELLYEHGEWPSLFNADHKHSFTLRFNPVLPRSHNLLNLLWKLPGAEIEHISLLTENFVWSSPIGEDQTMGSAECAIEFVVRKES